MTPKFGIESSGISNRAAKASKSSRDGAGGDDIDELIDVISGNAEPTGSISSFKYAAPITIGGHQSSI
jgi:hypothetical protein